MKKLMSVLIAAATLVGCNSHRCEIVGVIGDPAIEGGTIYLTDMWSSRSIIDSTEVKNGLYRFKCVEHEPTFAQLIHNSGRPIVYLFVEKGKIQIVDNYEDGISKAIGTPSNDAFNVMVERSQQLAGEYRNAIQSGDSAKAAEIDKSHDAMQLELMEANRGNVFGLFMIQQLSYSMPAVQMLEVLKELPDNIKSLSIVARMKESAERKFKTEPQAEGSDYTSLYQYRATSTKR